MNTETEFKKDWRLMFSDENLDGLIGLNEEQFREDSIDQIDRWGLSLSRDDREYFDQRFVCNVFADFLITCGSSPAPGVRFGKAELKDVMKGLGISPKDIRHDSKELRIRLTNAVFIISCENGAQVTLRDSLSPTHGFIKIGFLGTTGFADFIMRFDSIVPKLRQSIDEIYTEVKKYNDSRMTKASKIEKMIQIALKGKGIDYEYHLVGDKVHLKLERIVYTRVEEDVDFDSLAEYLGKVPEIMKTTIPKVTKGSRDGMFPEAVSFGCSRDKVYGRLVKGTQEDITGK